MEIQDATVLANVLMFNHGLNDWTFEFDRAKRRAGRCSYRTKTISLSREYVTRNPQEEIVDTILHEIAHALAGPGTGHGEVWKVVCRRIGAKPIRCYSNTVEMPKGRLVAVCGGCQKSFHRHRQTRKGGYRYCLNCGPDKGRLEYGVATEGEKLSK